VRCRGCFTGTEQRVGLPDAAPLTRSRLGVWLSCQAISRPQDLDFRPIITIAFHQHNVMNRVPWPSGIRASPPRQSLRPLRLSRRRNISTKPDDLNPVASQTTRSRVVRITSKLPNFLQRYSTPLITAPITHISAFLLLHELTAVVPLFGLAATFHYTHWMPPFISEGKWVSDGVEKFGNYFRRKGWLGEEGKARRFKWWGRGEGGTRIVVE
jgi:hypothetical protein